MQHLHVALQSPPVRSRLSTYAAMTILCGMVAWLASCKPADTDPPRMEVVQGLPEFLALGDTVPEVVLEVLDNRDCGLGSAVQREGEIDNSRYGDYAVRYSVQDEAGNPGELIFNVRVGLVPETYHAVAYKGLDSCTSGIYTYTAGIQDCTCPESRAHLFNLGNFGPGSYVNLLIGGDYGEMLQIERESGPLTWSGNGQTVRTGDTLYLEWQVDNGLSAEQCRTRLIREE